jgi:hypothetical protein
MNYSSQSRIRGSLLLSAFAGAAMVFSMAGCYQPTSGHVSVAANEVIGADDYVYYPGSEVYYSPAHRYYMYYDGPTWVRRPAPPPVWVRESPSVTIHFKDSPERHHPETVRRYPRNWHAAPHDRDHHDHDDRDGDRDRR